MREIKINSWLELSDWLDGFKPAEKKFAFRGQADAEWHLTTRLARHFLDNHVNEHQWRLRERKMYCHFRTRLLKTCPHMYDDWPPPAILSLMQHHGAPTRLLDFSYDPKVAAYFALEDSRDRSAIWVVDCPFLEQRRQEKGLDPYCGPTHEPDCREFQKDPDGRYRLVASILESTHSHGRLVAQRGCFLVPGSISEWVDESLVHTKVELSADLVDESLEHLSAEGYNRDRLFPDLDRIARQAKRSAVLGGPDCACGPSKKT